MFRKIGVTVCFSLLSFQVLFSQSQEFIKDSIASRNLYYSGIALSRNFQLSEAIDSFRMSLEIRKRLFGPQSYDVAIAHSALGIMYKNIGDYDNAIEYYQLTEEYYLKDFQKNALRIARLYNNMGNVYMNTFNYTSALDYYNRAIDIYSSQSEMDVQDIAGLFYNVANIHYELNDYQKTLSIIKRYSEQSNEDTRLLFLGLKAATLQQLNRNEEAYRSYQEVIQYIKTAPSASEQDLVFEYLNFARFLIYQNAFDEAIGILEKVNTIYTKQKTTEGTNLALYYKAMGTYFENLNVESKDIETFRAQKSEQLNRSIGFYRKGLDALNFDAHNTHPDSIMDISQNLSLTQTLEFLKLIADTYLQKAEIFDEKENGRYREALSKAIKYYKITSGMIQQARREIYSDDSKMQLNALEEATFYKIIQTAYKAHAIREDQGMAEFAFASSERIKSSTVFERITEQAAKENSLIPDSLAELEKRINFKITSNNETLYHLTSSAKPDEAKIAQTKAKIFELKKQRDELNHYLERNYSDFYRLKYAGLQVSLAEIQKLLPGNEVLLEYVFNETDSIPELYSFFISSDDARFIRHEINKDFVTSIEKMFRFMSNPEFLFTRSEDSHEYCSTASYLYDVLIKPFAGEIQNKKLTIIPDGKLNYITFEALLKSCPEKAKPVQFSSLPYLIRDHTINYAYSANILFLEHMAKRKTNNKVLAFAPEYKEDTIEFKNEKLALIPLPGVQHEVDLIAEKMKTSLFSGRMASESNFRSHCADYGILHLAMHAFINDSLPAFSRFAFTQPENHHQTMPRENDGWLNTADIYNLDLNARLTVLSACNTGTGALRKGEGIISLARGFLYAGCPSIIMTKWAVKDNAGTKIMSSFYHNLRKGSATDEALRLAKLEYLENANPRMAHPHYWMGYVSIGNASPLFRGYDFYFFGLLILALAGVAIDQTLRIRKARKKDNKQP